MKIKPLVFLIFLFFLVNCQPNNSLRNRLWQRVTQYYEFLLRGDFGSTWDYLWHEARQNRNRDEWIIFCKESDLESKLIEFRINSISISKVKKHIYLAKVKLIGKNMLLKENKTEYAEGEDEWVTENGDWFRYID